LEIVFCAVASHEQMKGYGTYLMNHLKAYAQANKFGSFLTFADNNAIGYFKRQGYSMNITIPKTVTHGAIKEYDGGTLMQCEIIPGIHYLDLSGMLRQQRQAVEHQIKLQGTSAKVHAGLRVFEEGGTFIAIDQIDGVKEAGWKPETESMANKIASDAVSNEKALQSAFRQCVREIRNHKQAWPFTDPVNPQDVPDYYEIIKEPMHLKLIGQRIKDKFYTSKEPFVRDVNKMFENCKKYNSKTSEYWQAAEDLQAWCRALFTRIKDT